MLTTLVKSFIDTLQNRLPLIVRVRLLHFFSLFYAEPIDPWNEIKQSRSLNPSSYHTEQDLNDLNTVWNTVLDDHSLSYNDDDTSSPWGSDSVRSNEYGGRSNRGSLSHNSIDHWNHRRAPMRIPPFSEPDWRQRISTGNMDADSQLASAVRSKSSNLNEPCARNEDSVYSKSIQNTPLRADPMDQRYPDIRRPISKSTICHLNAPLPLQNSIPLFNARSSRCTSKSSNETCSLPQKETNNTNTGKVLQKLAETTVPVEAVREPTREAAVEAGHVQTKHYMPHEGFLANKSLNYGTWRMESGREAAEDTESFTSCESLQEPLQGNTTKTKTAGGVVIKQHKAKTRLGSRRYLHSRKL